MATIVGTLPCHANRSNSTSPNLTITSRKGTLHRMEESFATADTASMTAESSSDSSASNSDVDNDVYGYGEGSPDDRAAFTSPVKVPFPKSTNKNRHHQKQQQQQLPPPQWVRSRRASFNDLPPPGFAGSGETPNFLEEYMKMAAADESNDDEMDDGMLSHLLSKSKTPVRRRSSMPFSLNNSGDLSGAIASAVLDSSDVVAETKKKLMESPRKINQDELGMALKSDAVNGNGFSSRDRHHRPNSFDGSDNPMARTSFNDGPDVVPNSPPFMSPATLKKQSAEMERIDNRPSYASSSSSNTSRTSRPSQYLNGEEEIVFGDDGRSSEITGTKYDMECSEKSYSAPVVFSPTGYRPSKAFNGNDESSSSFRPNTSRSERRYLDSSSRSSSAANNRQYLDSSGRTSFTSPMASITSTNRNSFELSSRSSLDGSYRGPLDSSSKSLLANSSRSYVSAQSRESIMAKSAMPQFVYSVKYKRGTSNAILGPDLNRRSGDLPIGTYVKVQGDRGLNLGIVVGKISLHKYNPSEEGEQLQNLKKVVALANQEEVSAVPQIREEEKELLQLCRRMVFQMGLPMTVVEAELQFDREKITFYYESERRVDHRGLVRWLYSILGVRIWMCQTYKPPPRPFSQYGKGQGKQPMEPSAPIIAPVSEWTN